MPIKVNVDIMPARRKMSSGEVAEKVGITAANQSILKTGKALDCQSGDSIVPETKRKIDNGTGFEYSGTD